MRKYTGLGLSAIGSTIGGRDHSTIIHLNKSAKALMECDKVFRRKVLEAEKMLDFLRPHKVD